MLHEKENFFQLVADCSKITWMHLLQAPKHIPKVLGILFTKDSDIGRTVRENC